MQIRITSTSGSIYEHPAITWDEDGYEGVADVISIDDLFSIAKLGKFAGVPSLIISFNQRNEVELEIYDTYRE